MKNVASAGSICQSWGVLRQHHLLSRTSHSSFGYHRDLTFSRKCITVDIRNKITCFCSDSSCRPTWRPTWSPSEVDVAIHCRFLIVNSDNFRLHGQDNSFSFIFVHFLPPLFSLALSLFPLLDLSISRSLDLPLSVIQCFLPP